MRPLELISIALLLALGRGQTQQVLQTTENVGDALQIGRAHV